MILAKFEGGTLDGTQEYLRNLIPALYTEEETYTPDHGYTENEIPVVIYKSS